MKFAEEFALPGTEELKSLEIWGNVNALILQAGRTTHTAPAGMAEEEKEEALENERIKSKTLSEIEEDDDVMNVYHTMQE